MVFLLQQGLIWLIYFYFQFLGLQSIDSNKIDNISNDFIDADQSAKTQFLRYCGSIWAWRRQKCDTVDHFVFAFSNLRYCGPRLRSCFNDFPELRYCSAGFTSGFSYFFHFSRIAILWCWNDPRSPPFGKFRTLGGLGGLESLGGLGGLSGRGKRRGSDDSGAAG